MKVSSCHDSTQKSANGFPLKASHSLPFLTVFSDFVSCFSFYVISFIATGISFMIYFIVAGKYPWLCCPGS
jgi:hypothetical protein